MRIPHERPIRRCARWWVRALLKGLAFACVLSIVALAVVEILPSPAVVPARLPEHPLAELDASEKNAEIRGVILVAHHPPFSVHLSGGDERVRESFWASAARRGKFFASFSGHHHAYQHIQVGARHAFVAGGGGSPQFNRALLFFDDAGAGCRSCHNVLPVSCMPAAKNP
jgi:hypothetical protein